MESVGTHRTKLPELSWLMDVTETRPPISELSPIWVRHAVVTSGPPIPHPERHPYCEIGICLEGSGWHFVEQEKAIRIPGDLFLTGPGVPHWGRITEYPLRTITVFFLPSVLVELRPASDGPRILRRFTAVQSLDERMVRPSPELRARLTSLFEEIVVEFEHNQFGREIRLRTLLTELLVVLLRWEQQQGRKLSGHLLDVDWNPISRALEYLREHYSEPVYARNVARTAGVSESRLKVLFHNALGMSWVKYLQGYRIHRAAALMNEIGCNVTDAAMAVGFESLSHFNTVFRSFMGVPPKAYGKITRQGGALGDNSRESGSS
ncbi:MAG: AraC family transcriptional regulator [Candidatus Omnitrophica bacterium]|nr:AraC family transcriptional regulator [Candidatus Omnitrophota bacterium]